MFQARNLALSTICMLLAATGLAEETKVSETDRDRSRLVQPNVQTLLAESEYGSRWQLERSVATPSYAEGWMSSFAKLRFHDASGMSRMGKMRSLSLLTLVETGRTRLFIGINADGLAGLHLKAIDRYDDDHHLDLARAPYLNKNASNRR